jgi:hypothetical protein
VKSGEEVLASYCFGAKRNLHRFCGECGSGVWFDPRMVLFGDMLMDLLVVDMSRLFFFFMTLCRLGRGEWTV